MTRIIYYSPEGNLRKDLHFNELQGLLLKKKGLLWVDFEGKPSEEESILIDTFGFHPLAVDDALKETHVPKLDDWGEYLYIVLNAVVFDKTMGQVETRELDIFIGHGYVVTHHELEIPAITTLWDLLQRDERHLKNGADHLLYRLADEVVGAYLPVVEQLDDAVDLAEVEIFGRPTPRTLSYIFSLKRAVLQLRRVIGPQREVLNKLARDDFRVIDWQARVYFRDVYDHLVRMHDLVESIRDLISGTLDTYLSVINNRMNEIMKTLTIITTLFMPLSFVAGFFGMNFFLPADPISTWMEPDIFLAVLLLMGAAPFAMYVWMRRRGWM